MKRIMKLAAIGAVATLVAIPNSGAIAELTGEPDAQAFIAKGDDLTALGKYGSARGEYRRAVELQRSLGILPAKALRRIANTYYYQDRYQAAGHTLVTLAEEAADYGDIVTQVWALADAAWIAALNSNKPVVERHLAAVERLLTSPYLPDEEKRKVRDTRLAVTASSQALVLTP